MFEKTLVCFLMSILLSVAVCQAVGKEEQDKYYAAYNMILDEKYAEAIQAFEKFRKEFPNSDKGDDAFFWICLAREKSGLSAEEAAKCYQNFIAAYPESDYADDATENLVRIAHQLVKKG
ncbi:MAG TPA: tetratricopeptide repeat protein, partial [Acidobacteriota bacterium]